MTLVIRNRQRLFKLDLPLLRRVARCLLQKHLRAQQFELALHLVEAPEMTQLNEKFLRHAGSTDVITFDYGMESGVLAGEIFMCVTEAQIQARRYRTNAASELVRYLLHGLLHLRGYDDRAPGLRRKMKREEDRLVGEISKQFRLSLLLKRRRSGGLRSGV